MSMRHSTPSSCSLRRTTRSRTSTASLRCVAAIGSQAFRNTGSSWAPISALPRDSGSAPIFRPRAAKSTAGTRPTCCPPARPRRAWTARQLTWSIAGFLCSSARSALCDVRRVWVIPPWSRPRCACRWRRRRSALPEPGGARLSARGRQGLILGRHRPSPGSAKASSVVRMRGLEPPRLAAPEPKSGASASSATSALGDGA